MTIKLTPCPFCEGPPKPIVVRCIGGGIFQECEMNGPDGMYAKAFVFCHECGAQSENVCDFVHDLDDCKRIEAEAVGNWQRRDSRHRQLYDWGDTDRLNDYPRGEITEVANGTVSPTDQTADSQGS